MIQEVIGSNKSVFVARCPVPHCTLLYAGDTDVAAQWMQDMHDCPSPTLIQVTTTEAQLPTLLENAWYQMDKQMNLLKTQTAADGDAGERLRTQHYLRAMAELIAPFMVPHFTTADDIARELVKRYRARVAGETYETPGLGHRRSEAPPTSDKAKYAPSARPAAPVSVEHNLSDEHIAAIRKNVATGAFTTAQIATAFGVSEAVILHVSAQ